MIGSVVESARIYYLCVCVCLSVCLSVCVCVAVVGGRSRLHLLDLGSCSRAKDGSALSLTSLGAVLLALLSGQRHVPHRSVTKGGSRVGERGGRGRGAAGAEGVEFGEGVSLSPTGEGSREGLCPLPREKF